MALFHFGSDKQKPKKQGLIGSIIAQQKNTFLPGTHIDINSNKELVLEGSRGVLEYSAQKIRLNCAGMVVCIKGAALTIHCLSEDVSMVSGKIESVEFIT